jgi:hypothetical protein
MIATGDKGPAWYTSIRVVVETLLRSFLLVVSAALLSAQDPLKTLPDNYHLVFENPQVRVIHVLYHPHEKLPVHDHPASPTVYVYLTDSGPVRFSHVEARAFSATRKPLHAGAFRLSPGRLEKHEVENLGDIPTEFLRVELKQVPLGFQRNDVRDYKPLDLTHPSVTVAFAGPFVKIERIIDSPIEKSDDPSLLIPLAKGGEVTWLNAHATSTASGHILRITFLPDAK